MMEGVLLQPHEKSLIEAYETIYEVAENTSRSLDLPWYCNCRSGIPRAVYMHTPNLGLHRRRCLFG